MNSPISSVEADSSVSPDTFVLMPTAHKEIRYGDLMASTRTKPGKRAWYQMMEGIRFRTVYIIWSQDQLLYIGASSYSPKERITGHLTSKDSAIGQYIKENRHCCNDWAIEVMSFATRQEAFEAEAYLIRELKPLLNTTYNRGNKDEWSQSE